MKGIRSAALIILAALLLASSAASVLSKPRFYGHRQGEILVQFKPGAPAREILKSHGAASSESIEKLRIHRVTLPRGWSIEKAISIFSKNPNVVFASPNHIVRATYEPNDWYWDEDVEVDLGIGFPFYFPGTWGFYNSSGRADVHAPEAWDITTGSPGVIIAIVDTGIDSTHPEFEGRLVQGWNAMANNPNPPYTDPNYTEDDMLHGTFVAGIAAATGDNYEGIAGMDWEASLMPIKVLDSDGYGDEFDAAEGVMWAVEHGAKVINMSLGAYLEPDNSNAPGLAALKAAVDAAWEAGCLIVCAAGNDYLDDAEYPHYPSYYDSAFSVGGTDDTDAPWQELYIDPETFEFYIIGTNYGDTLDVMAPSTYILSCVPRWYAPQVLLVDKSPYEFLSGTSAAAPFVSGLASLLWGQHPNWTNQQIRDQIEQTCDDIEESGPDRWSGWGRINAGRALATAPFEAQSIADLRTLPLQKRVTLPEKIVTAGTTQLGDRLYIEESDRSAGIMVYFGSTPPSPITIGETVQVSGKLALVNGQLAITEPVVTKKGTSTVPKPLGMRNKDVGGAETASGGVTGGTGLMNTGLLVRTWGYVTGIVTRSKYFYIEDGSKLDDGLGLPGLRVYYGDLNPPAKWQKVAVTGISTVFVPENTEDKAPAIRLRVQSDLVVQTP